MKRNDIGLRIVFALSLCSIPLASTAQVATADLEMREGLYYRIGADEPYTGVVLDPGESKGQIKNGRRSGEWVSWHENGVKSRVMHFDDQGRFTGIMQHWDRAGTLRESHGWLAGAEHGEATLFDNEGNLLRTANFDHGKKNGDEVWYFPDGKKLWETHFDDGARAGNWIQYDSDGNVVMKSTWEDGLLVSRENPRAKR